MAGNPCPSGSTLNGEGMCRPDSTFIKNPFTGKYPTYNGLAPGGGTGPAPATMPPPSAPPQAPTQQSGLAVGAQGGAPGTLPYAAPYSPPSPNLAPASPNYGASHAGDAPAQSSYSPIPTDLLAQVAASMKQNTTAAAPAAPQPAPTDFSGATPQYGGGGGQRGENPCAPGSTLNAEGMCRPDSSFIYNPTLGWPTYNRQAPGGYAGTPGGPTGATPNDPTAPGIPNPMRGNPNQASDAGSGGGGADTATPTPWMTYALIAAAGIGVVLLLRGRKGAAPRAKA